jgi:hypothetical protein
MEKIQWLSASERDHGGLAATLGAPIAGVEK